MGREGGEEGVEEGGRGHCKNMDYRIWTNPRASYMQETSRDGGEWRRLPNF